MKGDERKMRNISFNLETDECTCNCQPEGVKMEFEVSRDRYVCPLCGTYIIQEELEDFYKKG